MSAPPTLDAATAPTGGPVALPRSRPSEQGVSSAAILEFLAETRRRGIELHGLMVLRHGHVVAEGWWAPYGPERIHLLYSLSKSFTSTAAGLAEAEGLLNLDDAALDHLPECADLDLQPWTRAITVHHLASMSTGHREDTLERARALDPDPARGFWQIPPEQPPGTVFCYNNTATLLLGRIVQRVTGQRLVDYLRPRLFEPLGIGETRWECALGFDQGFSGLYATTETIARFGQLYLDGGVREGRRILPPGWVDRASALHTPTAPPEVNPDWAQGYGYQFWQSRHGYRGDGAYGQLCLVLPEQDAVIAVNAATEEMQSELDAVWATLLPGLGAGATPERDEELAAALADLRLSVPGGSAGPEDTAAGAGAGSPTGSYAPDAATRERLPTLGTLTVGDGDPYPVQLADGADTLRCSAGHRTWSVTEGAAPLAAAVDGSRLAVIRLESPHTLLLQLDRAAGTYRAAWTTDPLAGMRPTWQPQR